VLENRKPTVRSSKSGPNKINIFTQLFFEGPVLISEEPSVDIALLKKIETSAVIAAVQGRRK